VTLARHEARLQRIEAKRVKTREQVISGLEWLLQYDHRAEVEKVLVRAAELYQDRLRRGEEDHRQRQIHEKAMVSMDGHGRGARVKLFCEGCGEVAFAWSSKPDDPVAARFGGIHQGGGHQVIREPVEEVVAP